MLAGVPTRPNTRKLTDNDVPAIAARYAAGESTAVIATDHRVDPMTIARELRRAGHQLRPRRGA